MDFTIVKTWYEKPLDSLLAEIECPNCGSHFVIAMEKFKKPTLYCPKCGYPHLLNVIKKEKFNPSIRDE